MVPRQKIARQKIPWFVEVLVQPNLVTGDGTAFTKLCIDLADSTSGRKIRRCIPRFTFHCSHSLPQGEPRARRETV